MAKQLQRIELSVIGTLNPDGTWEIKIAADLTIGLSEYPEWIVHKGIPIVATNIQDQPVRSFLTDVVLPQAEAAK